MAEPAKMRRTSKLNSSVTISEYIYYITLTKIKLKDMLSMTTDFKKQNNQIYQIIACNCQQ